MADIVVNGVSLSYHEWPSRGPMLLCVHGISANCRAWDCWAEQLAPAYRVIALDLRGRGGSDKPPAYPVEVHRDLGCYPRDLDAAMRTLCRKPTAASDLRFHNMLQWTKILMPSPI